MKHLKLTFVLVSTTILLSACFEKKADHSDNEQKTVLELDTVPQVLRNESLLAFEKYVETTDSTPENMLVVVGRFKELMATENPAIVDSAILKFEVFYRSVEANLNEKIMNDTTDFSVIWMGETIPNHIKQYQKKLKDNGFKLASSEGMAYVMQDRSFVAKHLYDFVSTEMKNYLMQIQKESDEGFADDAYITISPRQHVERIIWYEKFIAQNSDFILIENCKSYHKAYLTYIFTGLDNSPLYVSEENLQLNPYFDTAYKLALNKYSDSEMAKLIKPFYEAVKAKDKILANKILKDYHVKGFLLTF